MTEEAAKLVWGNAGYTEAEGSGPQKELYEMLHELRRLQSVAREADNAVLAHYCLLWKAYETKCESLKGEAIAKVAKSALPDSPAAIVRLLVNGEPLMRSELRRKMVNKFGDVLTDGQFASGLAHLVETKQVIKLGLPGKLRFIARVASMFLFFALVGCRTSEPIPDPIPAAIMPRRMPDAPRPDETVKSIPTTVSRSLSWTHSPMPGLRTYRVDYGVSPYLTHSLITGATNCTIALEVQTENNYLFNVRGCDGRHYYELHNLHLVFE